MVTTTGKNPVDSRNSIPATDRFLRYNQKQKPPVLPRNPVAMSTNQTRIITFLVVVAVVGSGIAQDETQKSSGKTEDSTLKGRIVQHAEADFKIELNDLQCTLNQQVELPEPPVPKQQWPTMTRQQRTEWVKNFEASEQGKKFLEDRKQRIAAADRFEIQIEKNGNFTVYDVPAGIYGLRGRLAKTLNSKEYMFEVFGQIRVDKAVEVMLDPIPVVVTRIIKANEPVPEVNLLSFDKKATIDNKLLKDRNVLVSFWSLDSPPSVEFAKVVQQTFLEIKVKKKIELLCICVAGDRTKSFKHVKENKLVGWHGFTDSWEHETVTEFGVRSIPVLFLLGDDNKVKMTPFDFRAAMSVPGKKLADVVVDVLDGKTIPTPARTAKPVNAASNQKQ